MLLDDLIFVFLFFFSHCHSAKGSVHLQRTKAISQAPCNWVYSRTITAVSVWPEWSRRSQTHLPLFKEIKVRQIEGRRLFPQQPKQKHGSRAKTASGVTARSHRRKSSTLSVLRQALKAMTCWALNGAAELRTTLLLPLPLLSRWL